MDSSYWSRSANRPNGRVSRRALIRRGAGGAVVLAGAALLGCDTRTTPPLPTGTAVPATTPTATPATTTGQAPRRGGTLRIGGQLTSDVAGFDYDRLGSAAIGSVANLAGVKLVQWDERPGRPGPVEGVLPDLAESWETPDGGLTWNFKLRRGVKTSDGLEVKAEDVVWSLNRQAAVRPARPGLLEGNLPDLYTRKQVNARAIDDATVQIKIARPDADFLSMMGSHWWTIQHKDVVTKQGAQPGTAPGGWGEITGIDQIRGGGAYYPVEHSAASGFKLRRNPNYYDTSVALVDEIEHPLIADPVDAAAALEAGRLDAFGPLTQVTVAQATQLQQSEKVNVDWQPCIAWNPWIFDMRSAPFNDVRVRRALALAIDREAWIKNLLLGRGRNGTMVLPWLSYWALDPAKMEDDGKYFTYDPTEAKRLLLAAGQEKLKFVLQTSNNSAYTTTYRYADLMSSMLGGVGVVQETRIVEHAAHIGGETFPGRGIYQSAVARPDIQSYAYGQVGLGGTTVGGADVWGGLAQVDEEYRAFREVAEKQRVTQDRTARRELIYDMQRRMARNVWSFYWPAPDSPIVSSKKLHNFRPVPGWNWGSMKHVWKDA